MGKKKSLFREIIEIVLIAFILASAIKIFAFELYKIPTGSMRPTLLEGDRIVVVKFIYGPRIPLLRIRLPGLRQPKRGEVIVFISPDDPKKVFIKRLVATGGETVEILNGKVLINGKVIDNPPPFRSIFYYNKGIYGKENKAIYVPEDCYFVLGDNSLFSRDSRYWGFVPKRQIIGKAVLICWPSKRVQFIYDR